jgi:hypothetical protein
MLLLIDDKNLIKDNNLSKNEIIIRGYGAIETAKSDAEAYIEEVKKEVCQACIDTLNAMYSD